MFPDLAGAVVVHDRYQNYDAFPGLTHQLCCQHLLRDLEDAAAVLSGRDLAGPDRRCPAGPDPRREPAREQGLAAVPDEARRAAPEAVPARRPRSACAGAPASRRPREQPPARPLLECLRDREDDVLRFLSDLRIPPTSNQAERDVRPAKTQQKISGRLRSERATRHRYAIRGYISTAAKHGTNVFTALRDALTGNAWMPPIPADA